MGSIHKARCECGYSSGIRVGGTRATYRTESYFPYCCDICGLVDVNIAAEKLECPRCHGMAVREYGKEPISQTNDSHLVLQNYSHEARENSNYCPSCKKFKLIFSEKIFMLD